MQTKVNKKTSHVDWHPADILAALRKRGITLAGIARANDLKDSSGLSVAMVRSFPVGEKRISDALGVHPKVIWPSRYNPDGTRKPRGIRDVQFNAEARVRNSKASDNAAEQCDAGERIVAERRCA